MAHRIQDTSCQFFSTDAAQDEEKKTKVLLPAGVLKSAAHTV
jgi:hypothetical protein